MPICLATATKTVLVAAEVVTLVWTHSVEKVEWRETWGLAPASVAAPARLVPVEARVKGSGAGMDPGPDARSVTDADGTWWVWRPALPPLGEIRLARSGATADWRLCSHHACRTVGEILGVEAGTEPGADAVLKPCDRAD